MNTLKTQAKAELEKLENQRSYPIHLRCEVPGQRLEAEVVALDTLACAFNYLGVESPPYRPPRLKRSNRSPRSCRVA